MIDEETWDEWLLHPATKRLREFARVERQELMEQWANGSFSDGFDVAMAVKNAGATGACSVYLQFMELSYQELVENDDGKQIGLGAQGKSSAD